MNENILDDNTFYSTVANKIRFAREEKGLDQESLGKMLDLTRTSITNIEKGRQRPSLHQIWVIARELNLSISDLIPPFDLCDRIGKWEKKVDSNYSEIDENQKKNVLNFISLTRNIK